MEGAPPLINDEKLFQQISQYLVQASLPVKQANRQMISEDFAFISSLVPAVFLFLEAGVSDVDKRFSLHNPKVIFNEEVLHCGAAAYAVCAHNWLDSNG
jgi:metal-dependent amidase/aminoacylase/carboxypeptidase family protein